MSMPWYGALPKRWEERTVKSLFRIRKDIAGSEDYSVLSITQRGIKIKDIGSYQGQMAQSYAKYQFVNIGDFAMNHMDLLTGWVDCAKVFGVTSPDYRVFVLDDKRQNSDYLLKILQLCYTQRIFYAFGRGAASEGRWRLPRKEFMNFMLPLPPRDEQDQVVRYLDWKVSQINKLLGAKRQQIELLGEQKRAVINEAVTRGGKGWKKSVCKREFVNLDYMRRPVEASARSQKGEVLYDYYGASGVVDKIDDYIFDQTTLLIAEDGANLVLRNLPLIYIATGKYWVNNHAHILVPKPDNDLMFMAYLLESIDYTIYITGAAQPKLSQDNLGRVPLNIPPFAEQQKISKYLDAQCSRIDKVITDLNEEITLFTEYRTRLISDVVTGKLNVRSVIVPEYEAVEDVAGETVGEDEEAVGVDDE